ncbi:malate dehydrogenase [Sulfurospirillum sp. T05]|uniref:Malate dehydrogenase n=1 Tax=Sulfurospirillum tamanense TaxID=2813362 RepID=A0ABS2WSB0_9BACT|nr:malic enzyme-like NAD(P)-binding protein [Sulfurospirillum tamanensis]MBN2964490.1 malate dehydrogenase [Sulfurospirillum tamanensis]
MSKTGKVEREEALEYHLGGKIGIEVTKPCVTQRDLSTAYSPGVAFPCLEIERDPKLAYEYTGKGNLVGVISDGTAVLGLGDIGALASKPVMEGKAVLFKKFAGVNAYDIEINEKDPDKFVDICVAISETFGGINLEDISGPRCFEIEQKLQERVNIPVMHDDQHGTAIISSAGLLNALEITGKKIEAIKIVVIGAGAAGVACAKMYKAMGAKNVIVLDSKGVINHKREGLDRVKQELVTQTDEETLEEAMKGADMVLGLSKAGILTPEMIGSMNADPIIFACANPTPEILPEEVAAVRSDAIMGTGRSDYPNQINNVLGFPFIFRGALDVRASKITESMKLAAAKALAALAKEDVPESIKKTYGREEMSFGRDYVIPTPFDKRVYVWVSAAVAQAAWEHKVANVESFDVEKYKEELEARI